MTVLNELEPFALQLILVLFALLLPALDYLFKDKIFKSHNYPNAVEYVRKRYFVERQGKHIKDSIRPKVIRLYQFDMELDKG